MLVRTIKAYGALRVLTLGITALHVPGGSDDEETTQDEVSSHTSEEDGSMVKVKKELENAEQPVAGTPLMRENEASVYWLCITLASQGEKRVPSKHLFSPLWFLIFFSLPPPPNNISWLEDRV